MTLKLPDNALVPTMYFIGVTTAQSSIMKLFPLWAEALGLKGAQIKGIDMDIHADAKEYRECVEFIKYDPLSLGALVTTHKIDLYTAARDMFDDLDPYALQFEEVSSISKRDGKLYGHAKDPISSGLSMEAFIPDRFWQEGGEAFIMGAGGSALAISSYLTDHNRGGHVPSKIIISNRSGQRLDSARKLLGSIDTPVPFEYYLCPHSEDNDQILQRLLPHSLIINATGLGKDRPGSPLGDDAVFPQNSLVWELNYRGALDFMHQANRQRKERGLHVEDGWIYFIHGWTQVIAEVFHIDLTDRVFNHLEQIAMDLRMGKSKPFSVNFSLNNGLSDTRPSLKRHLSQMAGMFADEAAYNTLLAEGDILLYEFYDLGIQEEPGNLAFGTSIVYPGKVGEEYFMTKGHFHTIIDTAEVYYCIGGRGYMLLENPEGESDLQEFTPGKAVYVPGRYAHRSINTGTEPMITFYVFRADAGHDYGTIESKGFRKVVIEQDGKPALVDNPKWI